jgi:tRNA A-37 threonylcarbamoyl transferase component Bud32
MFTPTIKGLTCPSTMSLRKFLNEELTRAGGERVHQHIDSCSACQQALQRLMGSLPGPFDALAPLNGDRSVGEDTVVSFDATQAIPKRLLHGEKTESAEKVPGYELLGELGRGGMGVVYKARQLRPDRIVALKMLLAGRHAAPLEQTRFLLEAQAVARLQHPHIVPLHEVGQHGELPYLTLEFVSGGNLANLLKGGTLAPDDAARLVEQVARGMHYAHERGIIHRDLKPANILLQRDEGREARDEEVASASTLIPKITDFGLAKNVAVSAELTPSLAIYGTPSYMAPEQASGKVKDVGATADVYALGAILYECLTGRPPFRGETPADTLLQVLGTEPTRPSHFAPVIPADLETICMKCLHKEAHRRYASALELAEDLRRFQAREPIQARPVGNVERLVKWCRRHPAVSALSMLVFLLTLLAGGLVAFQGLQAKTARAEARSAMSARARSQAAALADAIPARVPAILKELETNRADVQPLVRQLYQGEKDPLRRMRFALALLPVEPQTVRAPLMDWMLQADDPAEALLAREALRPHRAELAPILWAKADAAQTPAATRFRALVALAAFDPNNPRWHKLGSLVVEQLLAGNPAHHALWTEALHPVARIVFAPRSEAAYYPLKVGTKWHYRIQAEDGDKGTVVQQVAKIERIDGQPYVRIEAAIKGEPMASEHVTTTTAGIFRHRWNGTEYSPPIHLLKFPIQSGESWESEHKSGEKAFKVKCSVSKEDVEVPAGKFNAVAVHIRVMTEQKEILNSTYWFVAGIGAVKQTVLEDKRFTLALEKFEEGK